MLSPSVSSYCFGHEKQKEIFTQQMMKGCLGHAWLLTGDKGIGKATFAYYYTTILLEENSTQLIGKDLKTLDISHLSSYRLINNQIHPDFYCLEAEEENDLTVEKVRDLVHFLQKTPLLGKRRIAIIDGVNLMTRQAANALLKTLEEPPSQAVIFLISHGQTLGTLKSRCQHFSFHPLSTEITQKILDPYLKEYAVSQQQWLLTYLKGHPGILNYFSNEQFVLLETLQEFEQQGYTYEKILKFAEHYNDCPQSVRYAILFWLAHLIEARKENSSVCYKGAELWLEVNHFFNEFSFFHLDFSHLIIKIFGKIKPWLSYYTNE